jgi:hypothetical protein
MVTIGIAYFVMILSAFFSGILVVFGGTKYTLMFGAMIVGIVLMAFPARWLLILLIVFVFLIFGPLMYFFSMDTTWAPYLLSLEILFLAFVGLLDNKKIKLSDTYKSKKIPAFLWSSIFFIIVAIFSTVFGKPTSYTLLIGVRSYLFIWGVYLILVSKFIDQNFFRQIWTIFLVIAFVQIPITIYQRFVVAAHRASIHDRAYWDAVIGTFWGLKDGGGDSGGMAFFLLSVITIGISLWKFSQLSGLRVLLMVFLFFTPIMLGEIKIVYVLIPIMAILIFRSDFKHKPIIFFGGVFIACSIVVSVFLFGNLINTSSANLTTDKTWDQKFDAVIGFSTRLDIFSPDGVEVGRMTALKFWWDKNKDDPSRVMLGYGIGSTSSDGRGDRGVIARRYRGLRFGNSVAAVLLWDVGIIGLISFIFIFIFGGLRAGQLAKLESIPSFHRAFLHAASVIIYSSIVFIPYSTSLISNPTSQVLFFLMIGLVGFWNNKVGDIKKKYAFRMKVIER